MPSLYGGGGRADIESAWPCPPHEVRRFRVNCKASYVALYVRNFIRAPTASHDSDMLSNIVLSVDHTPDDKDLTAKTTPQTKAFMKTTIDEMPASSGTSANMQFNKKKNTTKETKTINPSDSANKDLQKVDVVDDAISDSSGTTLVLGEAPKKKTRPANWGSGGTFMGRRPPKHPEKRAIFEQKRADWKAQQAEKKVRKDGD